MTATPDTTIREIVASDFRTAAIFQRFGLDFCCNGCRTVEEGCREAGADKDAVLRELDKVLETPASTVPRFSAWEPGALVSYIVANHHGYVRQAIPVLLERTRKIADVHGAGHPELVHIARLFGRVADEMIDPMARGEGTLFPSTLGRDKPAAADTPLPRPPFGTVENPIRMMEQ